MLATAALVLFGHHCLEMCCLSLVELFRSPLAATVALFVVAIALALFY